MEISKIDSHNNEEKYKRVQMLLQNLIRFTISDRISI